LSLLPDCHAAICPDYLDQFGGTTIAGYDDSGHAGNNQDQFQVVVMHLVLHPGIPIFQFLFP
jgi:hypothetical protein